MMHNPGGLVFHECATDSSPVGLQGSYRFPWETSEQCTSGTIPYSD